MTTLSGLRATEEKLVRATIERLERQSRALAEGNLDDARTEGRLVRAAVRNLRVIKGWRQES